MSDEEERQQAKGKDVSADDARGKRGEQRSQRLHSQKS
jgi:hypothetical protein